MIFFINFKIFNYLTLIYFYKYYFFSFITLHFILIFISLICFLLGLFGFLFNTNNLLISIIFSEICFFGINFFFLINASFYSDCLGIYFYIFILTFLTIEVSFGLLLLLLFSQKKNIFFSLKFFFFY